jgi:ABC-type Fe3+ transport system substrate-binding protein
MIAVIVILILGIGVFLIGTGLFIVFSPNQTSTTTEPSSTTSQTTTTTTTTTIPTTTPPIVVGEKTLNILTRLDISAQNIFETSFLDTAFAIENNITDIKWMTPVNAFWDDLIDLGQVDVCWGGNVILYDALNQGNRLFPLVSPLMQDAASRVNSTIAGCAMKRNNTANELVWIASMLSTYGFTVNHDFLDSYSLPTPSTWENLSSPVYGQYLPLAPSIALVNAPYSSSSLQINELILQMLGWDSGWICLTRIAGNSIVYGDMVEAMIAIESQEVGISLCYDFYGFFSQERNPACEYIIPRDATLITGQPIAIAATSPQKALAEGFVDFVLSPYGQSLFLGSTFHALPVMSEAFNETGATGAEEIFRVFNQTIKSTSFELNETQFLATSTSTLDYFESAITDSNAELSSCWKTMVDAYFAGNITSNELDTFAVSMGTPVSIVDPVTMAVEKFTLEYAARINENMINDASYRSTVKSRWTNEAKIQYVTVQGSIESLFPWLEFQKASGFQIIGVAQVTSLVFLGLGGLSTIPYIRKRV